MLRKERRDGRSKYLLMIDAPFGLRCEYLVNPLGLGERLPRFTWLLSSAERGASPEAYEVRVAQLGVDLAGDSAEIWSTGKVEKGQDRECVYSGPQLMSRQHRQWAVRVWDGGKPTEWSAPASFEMGLLNAGDWQGAWITSGELIEARQPAQYLRREFELPSKKIVGARLYCTARGLYLASINGERIGHDQFRPGWTDYNRRIQTQTYDVTSLVSNGSNVVGIVLAEGWYCGHVCWFGRRQYGVVAQALCQLEVQFEDGKSQVIPSSADWRWSYGPIASADLLMGEAQDLGQEMPGWDRTGFDSGSWKAVKTAPIGQAPLKPQACESVVATRELAAISVSEPTPKTFIYDLGQNMVGVGQLSLNVPSGTKLTVRHGEMLNPDGTLYTTNLRAAKAVDSYEVPKGGNCVLTPHFTFHGFRYLELTGLDQRPPLDSVHGVVLGQGCRETGTFECSDPRLNHLHSNIVWGQRGNYLEVPTDCPQRDERLGWMGDAQIFARTATFNMDVAAFLSKWLVDVSDAQTDEGAFPNVAPNTQGLGDGAPGWADAGVIVPWVLHSVYGDLRVLERHYDSMRRYVDFVHKWNPNLIWRNRSSHNFGDWLSIEADTPRDVLATAFFARSAHLVALSAEALGMKEDHERYVKLFGRIAQAFVKEFVSSDGSVLGETQTGYVLALMFELLSPSLRPKVMSKLVADIENRQHLSTGFIGAGLLLPTLTRFGRTDLAYELLLTDTFPGWLFPLQHGATTIWERWDGWTPEKGFQDPGMNSFNHYAFGAVGEWMVANILGIDMQDGVPGFRSIRFHPKPGGGLTWAKGSYDSIRGRIESDWRVEGGKFRYRVRVPVGSTGHIVLPSSRESAIMESDAPLGKSTGIRSVRTAAGTTVIEVGSGEYRFECADPR